MKTRVETSVTKPATGLFPSTGNGTRASVGHMEVGDGGERREATLLRFDVVRSTQYADTSRENPSDLWKFMAAAGDLCMAQGGVHESYAGDSLMMTFGVRSPLEASAIRAVESAIQIRELSKDSKFVVRIGVHHGLSHLIDLHGEAWSAGTVVTGLGPTIVTRIEGIAPEAGIFASAAVVEMCEEWFGFEPAGSHRLRGLADEVELFMVGNRRSVESRLAARRSRAALVGRDDELAKARIALDAAGGLLVTGHAGIGKSRLVTELGLGEVMWIRCQEIGIFRPLGAVSRALASASIDISDRTRLRTTVSSLGLSAEMASAVVNALAPDPSQPAAVDTRAAVVSGIAELVVLVADRRGARLVIDDLHFADPLTFDVAMAISSAPNAHRRPPIATSRDPEHIDQWAGTNVALQPLSRAASRTMVEELIRAERALDLEQVERIVELAQGIPLFAEELTAAELRGDHKGLPRSISQLLGASVDRRPGAESRLLKLLAVVGRACPGDLLVELTTASGERRDEAAQALSDLLQGGMLVGDEVVNFRHDLLRHAAYERIPQAARPSLHELAADLMASDQHAAEFSFEEIARQYTAAQRLDQAAPLWLNAAVLASGTGAQASVLDLLDKGLEAVGDRPPDDPDLAAQYYQTRLTIHAWRGATRILTSPQGYEDQHARRDYQEAATILQASPQTIPAAYGIYWGLWAYYVVRGEFALARGHAERCVEAGETLGTPESRLVGFSTGGYQALYEGDLALARERLAEAAAIEVDVIQTPLPQDPTVASLIGLAAVASLDGRPEQAVDIVDRAYQAMANVAPHRRDFTAAYLGCFAAWVYQMSGRSDLARTAAEEAVLVAERGGIAMWSLAGQMHALIAEGSLGKPAAWQQLAPLLDVWGAVGVRLMGPYFTAWLAQHQFEDGRVDLAVESAERARRDADSSGEQFWMAPIVVLRNRFGVK